MIRFEILVSLVATMILSEIFTPFVRKLAFKIGAVDKPNVRRVNKIPMPTMGGLAIFISYTVGTTVLYLMHQFPSRIFFALLGGELIIIATGVIDDIYELKPRQKMLGITLAALEVYFIGGIRMTTFTFPLLGLIHFQWLSLPVTLLWILAITNAVNLIDGLDGLATGVSIISLSTMGIIGLFFLNANMFVSLLIFTLVAAMIGFLPYNFFPARIYLGDTGSLFIGFMTAVFSLFGLKNVTLISVGIPVMILGVPITDTVYAMIRRILNKKPISQADKHHLHHRLMQLGLTHRQTVMVIYGIALIFSFISLLYPISSIWGSVLLTIGLLFGLELFVEAIGLAGDNRQPLLDWIKRTVARLTSKSNH